MNVLDSVAASGAESVVKSFPWKELFVVIGCAVLVTAIAATEWELYSMSKQLNDAKLQTEVAVTNQRIAEDAAQQQADALAKAQAQHTQDVNAINGLNSAVAESRAESDKTIGELRHEIDTKQISDGPVPPVERAYIRGLRKPVPAPGSPAPSGKTSVFVPAGKPAQLPTGARTAGPGRSEGQ